MPQVNKDISIYNIDLQMAVRHLYDIGAITKDKEIADKTKFSPGQVSSYINGRAVMSLNFKECFESVFKLKLSDFKSKADDETEAKESPAESEDSYRAERIKKLEDDQEKYIRKLEKDNDRLWDLIKDNQEIIKTNLTLVLAAVKTLSVRQRGVGEVVLHSLERIEKKSTKASGALVEAADRAIDQIEREAYARDSDPAMSR